LNFVWLVSMLAWAMRLSHWIQSHSYKILYETCLDNRKIACIIKKSSHSSHSSSSSTFQISLRRGILNYYEMREMVVLCERTFKECSLDSWRGIWLIIDICPRIGCVVVFERWERISTWKQHVVHVEWNPETLLKSCCGLRALGKGLTALHRGQIKSIFFNFDLCPMSGQTNLFQFWLVSGHSAILTCVLPFWFVSGRPDTIFRRFPDG